VSACSCESAAGLEEASGVKASGEEELVMDDEENLRMIAIMKDKGRRRGVTAESTSIEQVKDYVKPVYAKDEASHARIKNIIAESDKMKVLFGHLDNAALEHIINAFYPVTETAGTDVIRQGDGGD
ncbi:unnamed protein product, partial [Polarella glacialis]